jgi:hypothetical protein
MKSSNLPIEVTQNGPEQMQVGTSDDGPIVGAIATKEKLYFIKTRAIYGIQLADQIDPDRQNPDTSAKAPRAICRVKTALTNPVASDLLASA